MHWLAVGGYDCHAMTFDRHLGRTHRCECIYQTESIAAPWRDGEYFQRSVCHEAGVGIAELTSPVDQHRLRVLAGVDGQPAGIAFGGVLVQPIAAFGRIIGALASNAQPNGRAVDGDYAGTLLT